MLHCFLVGLEALTGKLSQFIFSNTSDLRNENSAGLFLCRNSRKEQMPMAATRLIPLHVNKGKTIAQSLGDRTDYAKNLEKTEKGELVTGY